MRNLNFWSKIFILNFWRSQCLRLLRPCRKWRGWKKIKSTSFHQYSWNSEVETTWISLIGWHHKTSNTYPEKSDHGRKDLFLLSKRLSSGAPCIGFAAPGIEENTAGEPEGESIDGSNFSPASTIVGGWRLSSEGLGLAWHNRIFWLWGLPWQLL